MREREGATELGSYDLEATIRSASAREAKIMQKHGHGYQLGIGFERAMMCQLGAIEPRARNMVEEPGLRFSLCLFVGVPNGTTVR